MSSDPNPENHHESDTNDELISTNTQPDYSTIEPPTKPPTEYTYAERRADLLLEVQAVGHPGNLPTQTELADRYGVSQGQISQDLDRIAEHIDETLGEHRALITESVFQRCIRGLLNDGDYRAAARTVKDWNEWIDEYAAYQQLRERVDRVETSLDRREADKNPATQPYQRLNSSHTSMTDAAHTRKTTNRDDHS